MDQPIYGQRDRLGGDIHRYGTGMERKVERDKNTRHSYPATYG